MGPQGLYLNRWDPDFDPAIDVPKAVPVWVRLPNLPIHYWTTSSLQAIGNKLGTCIHKAHPKDNYSCARICVEVDLEAGLPEAIKLVIGEWHHFQKLDYEKLRFKCRHFHEYGDFQNNYPKKPSEVEKDPEEGWIQAKRSKPNPRLPPKKAENPRLVKTLVAPSNPNPKPVANNAP